MKVIEKMLLSTFYKSIKSMIRRSYKKGFRHGKYNGYVKGYQNGTLKYVIKNELDDVVMSPIDNSIYGPDLIGVEDKFKKLMFEKVKIATDAGIISSPSNSQWDMIFSDHPATCVVAGAGSGKSTTLVLRLVFMHFYLGIPLSKITVISFTKKSCEELTEKVIKVFQFWDNKIDTEKLASIVNTFHSLIYRFSISSMPGLNVFDFLGNKPDEDETALELPLGRKSQAQVEVLTCPQD